MYYVCGVLGDEYLLVCKNLSDLRQTYIHEYFKYRSMYTFFAIMSTKHVKTICNLAAFVYSSLQRIKLEFYFRFVSSYNYGEYMYYMKGHV